jgi:hypothetical protein
MTEDGRSRKAQILFEYMKSKHSGVKVSYLKQIIGLSDEEFDSVVLTLNKETEKVRVSSDGEVLTISYFAR